VLDGAFSIRLMTCHQDNKMHLHLPPHLALALCIVFILWLFWIDSRRHPRVHSGLWVVVAWMAVNCSRPLSMWFGATAGFSEGSPLERSVYSALIFAGLVVLLGRKEKFSFSGLVAENGPLFLLLGYYALSIVWSDYPFISFKRYIKLIGVLVMILVILTDADPVPALRTALRRCGYVAIFLSYTLIKYFPTMAVGYDNWTGARYVTGITNTKNMLGQLCLVFGLCFLWDIIVGRKEQLAKPDRLMLFINSCCLILAIYVLHMSQSDTSLVCMAFGSGVLLATGYDLVRRKIGFYIIAGLLASLSLNWLLDIVPAIVHALGRNMTLTDRTYIWNELLPMAKQNLWFGSGYEMFWTPKVMDIMQINEAHNGYFDMVLNTGLVGLSLFFIFIVSVYRRCRELLESNPEYGRFAMAFFFTALLYNFTEAAFRGLDIVYFIFLATSFRLPEAFDEHAVYAVRPSARPPHTNQAQM
jgi:exopolysaccharide production protein ExoQ